MLRAIRLGLLGAGIIGAGVALFSAGVPVMAQSEAKSQAALVCTLTTPELQARRTGIIKRLRESAQEYRELDAGWSMRYTEEQVSELVEFIRLERQCCNFFEFTLRFEPSAGPVWLSITGPAGAKTIIGAELGPTVPSTSSGVN